MKKVFHFALILAVTSLETDALEFEPLVDDWMISEEISIGGPIDTDTVINEKNMGGVFFPKIASNGSNYLVAWSGWDDGSQKQTIYGLIFDATGDSPSTRGAHADWLPVPDQAVRGRKPVCEIFPDRGRRDHCDRNNRIAGPESTG